MGSFQKPVNSDYLLWKFGKIPPSSFAEGKGSFFNPLTARIFTVFGHSLLEDRVLHKEAWVAKLLGTHLSI